MEISIKFSFKELLNSILLKILNIFISLIIKIYYGVYQNGILKEVQL